MLLKLNKNTLEYGPKGLEISVTGFKANPCDAECEPIQVYIEIYEGKLRICTWDGSSQDPQIVEIPPTH